MINVKTLDLFEKHFCYYCERRMIPNLTDWFCENCDAYKIVSASSVYFFSRRYKSKWYHFIINPISHTVIISNDMAHNVAFIKDPNKNLNPQNALQKLPLLLTFS